MRAILDLVLLVLDLYRYIIIAVAIISWLIAFNVVNLHNDIVRNVWSILQNLTEPVMRPIRRYMPAAGNIDLSPIVALLGIFLIQDIILRYIYPNVF